MNISFKLVGFEKIEENFNSGIMCEEFQCRLVKIIEGNVIYRLYRAFYTIVKLLDMKSRHSRKMIEIAIDIA